MAIKAKTPAKTTKAKATPRKPAVRKAVTAKKAASKSAPKITPKVVTKATPQVPTSVQGVTQTPPPSLRKKELIDIVVARSGIKKKDAKPVVEAMLDVLGETLASGKDMNLQPFGKVMVKKTIDKPNASVIVARVRQVKSRKVTLVKSAPDQAAE